MRKGSLDKRALPTTRRKLLRGIVAAATGPLTACYAPWTPPHSDRGWSNNIHTRCITPEKEFRPEGLAEIVRIVRDAEQRRVRIRAVGSGHSFSDVAFADGWLLRTSALDRTIAIRRERLKPKYRNEVLYHVEAGISLRALNAVLDSSGLGLPNMGGWDLQTLGGVISTSTHGSGLDYGPFPSLVASFVIVASGGRVIQLEPTDGITDPAAFAGGVDTPSGSVAAMLVQDDRAFHAAVVSMGSMGVIYSVVLRLGPAHWLHEEREQSTWEDVTAPEGYLYQLLSKGDALRADGSPPDHYEFLVNPYAVDGIHLCIVTRRWKRTRSDSASPGCAQRGSPFLHFATPFALMHPDMIPGLLNANPESAGRLLQATMPSLKDRCYEGPSYAVFNAGSFNEMPAYSVELAVDLQDTIVAVQRVLDSARDKLRLRAGVHSGPISVRFVKECDAFLSPQFGRPTCMIEMFALLGVLGTDALLLDHEVDLVKRFAARPHWGLDLSALHGLDQLQRLYPRCSDWLVQYRLYNSSGVFNGELTDRLDISMPGNQAYRTSLACLPG